MNREELHAYIQNAILVGNTHSAHDILSKIISKIPELDRVDLFIDNWVTFDFFSAANDSVELDGMYFKKQGDKIMLTGCVSTYKVINLGDAVDEIGPCAFLWNIDVKRIIAKAVTTIGKHCFTKSSVVYADFPKLKVMGEEAFSFSDIRKINIPSAIHISKAGFVCCSNLRTINAQNVRWISIAAFDECFNLIETKFDSVEFVGEYAFVGCKSLKKFNTTKLKAMSHIAFFNKTWKHFIGASTIHFSIKDKYRMYMAIRKERKTPLVYAPSL